MKILRQCPFYDRETRVEIASQSVDIRPHQMIVWASLRVGGLLSRRFQSAPVFVAPA